MICRHAIALAGLLMATGTRADEPTLVVRGVLRVGHEWQTAIGVGETGTRWFRPGEAVGSLVVVAIDAESVILVDAAGQRHVLRLRDAKVADRHTPPADALAWARWVNSRDNPMRDQPADPPLSVAQWRMASEEQRRAIAGWYRDHGWQLSATLEAFEFSLLHGDARQAIAAEKQRAFVAALSGEQRVLHTAALREPAREGSAAPDTDSARARFLAALNAQQRATFERIRDPEIAAPNPDFPGHPPQ